MIRGLVIVRPVKWYCVVAGACFVVCVQSRTSGQELCVRALSLAPAACCTLCLCDRAFSALVLGCNGDVGRLSDTACPPGRACQPPGHTGRPAGTRQQLQCVRRRTHGSAVSLHGATTPWHKVVATQSGGDHAAGAQRALSCRASHTPCSGCQSNTCCSCLFGSSHVWYGTRSIVPAQRIKMPSSDISVAFVLRRRC